MGSIRQLCKKAIVLENGIIIKQDYAENAVDFYLSRSKIAKTESLVFIEDTFRDKGLSREVEFVSFELNNDDGVYSSFEPIVFRIRLRGNKNHSDCRINCTVWDMEETPVGSVVSFDGFSIQSGEEKIIEYTIKSPGLANGLFTFSFSVGTGDATMGLTLYDAARNFITIEVNRIEENKFFVLWKKTWGNVYLHSSMKEILNNDEL